MKAIRSSQRRAMMAMMALVCLTVVMLLCAGWLRKLALERQQLRAMENALQAELLAESALNRAAARLAGDAAYVGETWQLPAERFNGRDSGVVEIAVEPVANQANLRDVRVTANYPAAGTSRVRRSKQSKIAVSQSGAMP